MPGKCFASEFVPETAAIKPEQLEPQDSSQHPKKRTSLEDAPRHKR